MAKKIKRFKYKGYAVYDCQAMNNDFALVTLRDKKRVTPFYQQAVKLTEISLTVPNARFRVVKLNELP